MLDDIGKTLGQLDDPRFIRVLLKSVVITLAFFVVLWLAVGLVLGSFEVFESRWLERAVDVLGGLAVVIVTIVIFPGAVSLVLGFFLEDVARAVEERHYPGMAPPREQSVAEAVGTGLRLGAVIVLVNLVLLPLYVVLIFLPPLNLVLFYVVNGYLLGREYFELVAFRRVPPKSARALRRRRRGQVWLAGAAIAFVFTVPLVNLAAPVAATALMVHRFERLRQRG